MKAIFKVFKGFLLLLLFWVLVFDFQRILFSIHNFQKISQFPFSDWIQVFFHSFRLDIAMASYLSFIPFTILILFLVFRKKAIFSIFKYFVLLEMLLIALVQAGEITAYPEWNHKLTTGVFVHFLHIDEIFRTADFWMTFWFFTYVVLQLIFGWRIFKWLFKRFKNVFEHVGLLVNLLLFIPILPIFLGIYFLFARGGFQQIPINIDAAYFSKNYIINDLSVNSSYFFGKSFLLYKRSDIGNYLSHYDNEKVKQILSDLYSYDKSPDIELLKNKRPNIIFVVLEGWSATVSNLYTNKPGATPVFDSLSQHGVLFKNIYASATTSEIGNSTIFSGYPALPEISITMQPYKNKELPALNQTLKQVGYSSSYLFGGDLKYGNIESYLMNHNFDQVKDESDFPTGLDRGKLNFYDEDLFKLFLQNINEQKKPFLACTFTGSTHSPYDCPAPKRNKWTGNKTPRYMNAVFYSDECIGNFIKEASKEPWYKNTLFVFVADHGHATPYVTNSNDPKLYHIPLLFFGEVLKDSVRGKKINTVGSQADIVQTLLQQMGINTGNDYPWSKNLLSKNVPQFALNATPRGFGWESPKGKFTFNFDYQKYIINRFSMQDLPIERQRCNAFMQLLYAQYKILGTKKTN